MARTSSGRATWVIAGAILVAIVLAIVLVGSRPHPDAPRPGPAPTDLSEAAAPAARAEPAGAESADVQLRAVRVRVLDCGHVPASGARVTVRAGDAELTGTADALGTFQADVPLASGAAAREVTALAALERPSGTHRGAASGAGPLDVVVCPGATVTGVVRDAHGRPLGEATVRFGAGEDVAVTDTDGEFVLTDLFLSADRVQVTHASGAAERLLSPPLAENETRTLDLVITSGHRVAGSVVGADGQAAPNVPVEARDGLDKVVARASADRDGRFWLTVPEVPGTGEGGGTLRIRADGGARGMAEVAIGAKEAREDLVLTLAAAGVVVVAWEGAAVDRIIVRGLPMNRKVPVPERLRAQNVASGEERVVPAPGFYEASVVLAAGGGDAIVTCGSGLLLAGQRLVFRCGRTRPAFLAMRVLGPDGRPRPGTPVAFAWPGAPIDHAAGVTDANGVLRQELALATSASVRVLVADHEPGLDALARVNVLAVPGETTELGDLQLRSAADVAAIMAQTETGAFGGIGGLLQSGDGGVRFERVIRGGPLDLAGVQPGDIVLGVSGTSATQLDVREAMLAFRGPTGSVLTLHLHRPGEGEFDVEVERAMIDAKRSEWVE